MHVVLDPTIRRSMFNVECEQATQRSPSRGESSQFMNCIHVGPIQEIKVDCYSLNRQDHGRQNAHTLMLDLIDTKDTA